jgi:hypothetical protein
MNFFWRLFGYYDTDICQEPTNISDNITINIKNDIVSIETKLEKEKEKELEKKIVKKIEKEIPNKQNFEIFYKNYNDEILNKTELKIVYDNIYINKYNKNINKIFNELKYKEFYKILNEIKQEKEINYNMDLIDIKINKDKNAYIYTYKYVDFENFYEYWTNNMDNKLILTKDEFNIIYNNIIEKSYSTDEYDNIFWDMQNVLDNIYYNKKENNNKTLINMIFLGKTYFNEDENGFQINVYKYFF